MQVSYSWSGGSGWSESNKWSDNNCRFWPAASGTTAAADETADDFMHSEQLTTRKRKSYNTELSENMSREFAQRHAAGYDWQDPGDAWRRDSSEVLLMKKLKEKPTNLMSAFDTALHTPSIRQSKDELAFTSHSCKNTRSLRLRATSSITSLWHAIDIWMPCQEGVRRSC